MPITWYFKKDGVEHGPISSQEIRELAALGMLGPTDLVRKSEMTRWALASALKGLFPAAVTTPAAPAVKTISAASPTARPQASKPTMQITAPAGQTAAPRWIWYLAGTAALFVIAGESYRLSLPGSMRSSPPLHAEGKISSTSTTGPAILAGDANDPLLLAISSLSPFERGLALRQLRASTVPANLRGQVHQIICDTLDNRTYSGIWSSAARALAEVGSPDDVDRLKLFINSESVDTQCAAMAAAMILDPAAGVKLFETRAADETRGGTTAGDLADYGSRCEPAALEMLKSPQRMCRYRALFLLKAFGSRDAIAAITTAKHSEADKMIAGGYQGAIDAINARMPDQFRSTTAVAQ